MRGSPPHTRGKLTSIITGIIDIRITPAYAGKTMPQHAGIRSPPHTREKLYYTLMKLSTPRIAPAYAGKTLRSNIALPYHKDHPRIRGENVHWLPTGLRRAGSPPHTRGKHKIVFRYEFRPRITPAYAGKTLRKGYQVLAAQDHPRIRGENRRKLH